MNFREMQTFIPQQTPTSHDDSGMLFSLSILDSSPTKHSHVPLFNMIVMKSKSNNMARLEHHISDSIHLITARK